MGGLTGGVFMSLSFMSFLASCYPGDWISDDLMFTKWTRMWQCLKTGKNKLKARYIT